MSKLSESKYSLRPCHLLYLGVSVYLIPCRRRTLRVRVVPSDSRLSIEVMFVIHPSTTHRHVSLGTSSTVNKNTPRSFSKYLCPYKYGPSHPKVVRFDPYPSLRSRSHRITPSPTHSRPNQPFNPIEVSGVTSVVSSFGSVQKKSIIPFTAHYQEWVRYLLSFRFSTNSSFPTF